MRDFVVQASVSCPPATVKLSHIPRARIKSSPSGHCFPTRYLNSLTTQTTVCVCESQSTVKQYSFILHEGLGYADFDSQNEVSTPQVCHRLINALIGKVGTVSASRDSTLFIVAILPDAFCCFADNSVSLSSLPSSREWCTEATKAEKLQRIANATNGVRRSTR